MSIGSDNWTSIWSDSQHLAMLSDTEREEIFVSRLWSSLQDYSKCLFPTYSNSHKACCLLGLFFYSDMWVAWPARLSLNSIPSVNTYVIWSCPYIWFGVTCNRLHSRQLIREDHTPPDRVLLPSCSRQGIHALSTEHRSLLHGLLFQIPNCESSQLHHYNLCIISVHAAVGM